VAERLVDAAGMDREHKVMGVTGKVQEKDKEENVWPFIAGEVQDIPADAKESLPVGPA
jgi:hypothetical protein